MWNSHNSHPFYDFDLLNRLVVVLMRVAKAHPTSFALTLARDNLIVSQVYILSSFKFR